MQLGNKKMTLVIIGLALLLVGSIQIGHELEKAFAQEEGKTIVIKIKDGVSSSDQEPIVKENLQTLQFS